LEQYKCWCERANIPWGGGLGIGGGVMLHVLFKIAFLWSGIQIAMGIIFSIFSGTFVMRNSINALLSGLATTSILLLFLYSGMLFFEFLLARAIKNKRSIKNKYTRVMLPSFIFLPVANIFMFLTLIFRSKNRLK